MGRKNWTLKAADLALGSASHLTVTFLDLRVLTDKMDIICPSPGVLEEASDAMVVKSCLCPGEGTKEIHVDLKQLQLGGTPQVLMAFPDWHRWGEWGELRLLVYWLGWEGGVRELICGIAGL